MAITRGKQFESKVKEDLLKLPNAVVERLPDQMTGYKGTSSNVADFIFFNWGKLHFIECKTTQENTFPLTNLTQYPELLKRACKKNVRSGVILWFIKWDKIVYIPIKTIEKLKFENAKSVNIKMVGNNDYRIIDIPSIKKRVFFDSDYNILEYLQEGD